MVSPAGSGRSTSPPRAHCRTHMQGATACTSAAPANRVHQERRPTDCARSHRSGEASGQLWRGLHPTWFNQDACTGVCTMTAFGYRWDNRSIAAFPRCEEPLSTIQKTRRAEAYGSAVMT